MNNGYIKDVQTKEDNRPETVIPKTHDSCIYAKKDGGCKAKFKCSYFKNGACRLPE